MTAYRVQVNRAFFTLREQGLQVPAWLAYAKVLHGLRSPGYEIHEIHEKMRTPTGMVGIGDEDLTLFNERLDTIIRDVEDREQQGVFLAAVATNSAGPSNSNPNRLRSRAKPTQETSNAPKDRKLGWTEESEEGFSVFINEQKKLIKGPKRTFDGNCPHCGSGHDVKDRYYLEPRKRIPTWRPMRPQRVFKWPTKNTPNTVDESSSQAPNLTGYRNQTQGHPSRMLPENGGQIGTVIQGRATNERYEVYNLENDVSVSGDESQ